MKEAAERWCRWAFSPWVPGDLRRAFGLPKLVSSNEGGGEHDL